MSNDARVRLEKGSLPLRSQLSEAAKIAGFNLELPGETSVDETARSPKLSAPRAEWVLRWLSKKLRSPEHMPDLVHDPQTWILMRQLLQRVPLRNASHILKEFDFMNRLESASKFLGDLCGLSEPSLSGSPSSRQWVADTPARKRKRSPLDEVPEPHTAHWSLLPILEALQVLIVLVEQAPDNVSAQHGMLALGSPSKTVASILGQLIALTNTCLKDDEESMEGAQIEAVLAALQSVLKLWKFRSHPNGDVTDDASNVSYRLRDR